MILHDLIQFAKAYDKLGTSIQQQLDAVLSSEYDDINPNALKVINDNLRGYDDDLDIAIDEALAATKVGQR